jgi:hypothetical protein
MRSTFGSVVFQVFDKVIVAILVLLALLFVAFAVIREPASVIDRKEVEALKKTVRKKQKRSVHKTKPLTVDYLGATVGAFRPGLAVFEPRSRVGGAIVVDKVHKYQRQTFVRIPGEPLAAKSLTVEKDHAGAEIRILNNKLVKAEWVKDKPRVLALTPLETDSKKLERTTIELFKEDRKVAVIPVLSRFSPPRKPTISPPRIAAQHTQGKVRLTVGKAGTVQSVVTEYLIYRGESEAGLEPYLRIIIPDGSDPEAVPSVVRAADGKPAGKVKVVPIGFVFVDSDVDGGVRYWYAAKAVGKSKKDGKPLRSGKSSPVVVNVPEGFKIRFYTLSPDYVAVVVTVRHVPADGGPAVELEHTFRRGVVRGQVVGWMVPEVTVPGQKDKIKNVDFSTGYQILDIVNGERRVRKERPGAAAEPAKPAKRAKPAKAAEPAKPVAEDENVREYEEKRQKLLLINERGRIKVLWPSVRGRQ